MEQKFKKKVAIIELHTKTENLLPKRKNSREIIFESYDNDSCTDATNSKSLSHYLLYDYM